MTGHWEKRGLIYVPDGNVDWSVTHAQVPVTDYNAADNTVKIYFSTRDTEGRSLPGFVVVNADDPKQILEIAQQPVLPLGNRGTFDDCGVMPSWIVKHGDRKYMYYIGWNVRNTIPYHNAVGLAVSDDDGKSWKKFSEGPVMERNHIEPHYNGTSCVIIENGTWKNWYLSCTEWRMVNGRVEPRYHIKYAESADGIIWKREGKVAIDYLNDEEAGIVKASVIVENGVYRMWFSYRSFTDYRTDAKNSYRIGYAESRDGLQWTRSASPVLELGSENEFDSMMTCYPHVADMGGRRLMFYNGNGFGRSGFGFAEFLTK